jgi:hypothetical protein
MELRFVSLEFSVDGVHTRVAVAAVAWGGAITDVGAAVSSSRAAKRLEVKREA